MWKYLWNWVTGRGWESFEVCARKIQDCLIKTIGRNMNVRGDLGENSGGNKDHTIGNWRKDDPFYKVAKNLAELCSSV